MLAKVLHVVQRAATLSKEGPEFTDSIICVIATIDTSVAGGSNIIGVFGQWGAIQLLLAGLLWVLLIRYPGTLPLVLCVFAAEPLLRSLAGHLKPIETVGTAPGSAFNYALTPIVLSALYLALCPGRARDRST